jgi:uncharacterized protein YlbG (UPF0298 family)
VFPVKYELVLYIPEDAILHSLRRENSNLTFIRVLQIPFQSTIATPFQGQQTKATDGVSACGLGSTPAEKKWL